MPKSLDRRPLWSAPSATPFGGSRVVGGPTQGSARTSLYPGLPYAATSWLFMSRIHGRVWAMIRRHFVAIHVTSTRQSLGYDTPPLRGYSCHEHTATSAGARSSCRFVSIRGSLFWVAANGCARLKAALALRAEDRCVAASERSRAAKGELWARVLASILARGRSKWRRREERLPKGVTGITPAERPPNASRRDLVRPNALCMSGWIFPTISLYRLGAGVAVFSGCGWRFGRVAAWRNVGVGLSGVRCAGHTWANRWNGGAAFHVMPRWPAA